VEDHDMSKVPNEFVSHASVTAAFQTNVSFRFLKADVSLDAEKLQIFPPGSELSCSFSIKSLSENWLAI
jgi:hypothetical protein